MVYPVWGAAAGRDAGGPDGHTYGAVLVRADAARVLAAAREIRFSGWVAREAGDGWVPVVTASAGTVAAGKRGIVGVGEALARLGAPTLAIRVLADRQLVLAAWAEGEEIGRYVSDPSREPGADEDVLDMVYGDEIAHPLAALCDRPDDGDDLAELLGEELDTEYTIESERLGKVARLLGLPTWLVAVPSLPREIPTGPSRRDLVRLGAGLPGIAGMVAGRAVDVIRKRRTPPPVVTDAPRSTSSGMDLWLM